MFAVQKNHVVLCLVCCGETALYALLKGLFHKEFVCINRIQFVFEVLLELASQPNRPTVSCPGGALAAFEHVTAEQARVFKFI